MNIPNPDYTPNCLNFDAKVNVNQAIFRVIPIERLILLVKNKTNVLVHPSKWDDPFENFLLKSKFELGGNDLSVAELRDNLFGQCWTLRIKETDAIWRIYSPEKNGVRVKSTIKNVFEPLVRQQNNLWNDTAYFGKVNYVKGRELSKIVENSFSDQSSSIVNGLPIIKSLLTKRKAFEHEKEVRVIYRGKPNLTGGIHGYNINPQEFIQELLFDPRMDENLFAIFEDFLRTELPMCDISQSSLYKDPDFTIHLKV